MGNTHEKRRLSREESRQQTRERLLAAAATVIPRAGFQGASVEEITAEAGFSRGAFYSNFEDKNELFATLLQQMADEENSRLDAIFNQGGSASEMRLNLRAFYANAYRTEQQLVLYTEAKIHAARDEAFRKRLLELQHITHDRVTGFVERYCREYGLQHKGATEEEITIGLMALIEGLTFTRMLDPDSISDDKATAVLLSFFDAVMGG